MESYTLTIPCSFQVRKIVFTLLVIFTVCGLSKEFENHKSNETFASLTGTVTNLLSLQNEQDQRCAKGTCKSTILIMYQQEMWQTAAALHDVAVNMDSTWLFLTMEISRKNIALDVDQSMRIFDSHFDNLHCVIIVSDSIELAASLIQKVCNDTTFKWTRLLHTTEWIIVSKIAEMFLNLKSTTICIDFMTLVISSGGRVSLARKTRGDNTFKFKLMHSYNAWCVKRMMSFFEFPSRRAKSELKGMNLPIAINFNEIRYTSVVSRGQRSNVKGFSFSLLDLLAEWLGFTYTFVLAGGGYGYVNEDGTAIGITGLVARREAAFSVMLMNKISNRLQVNDFLDYPVSFDQLRLMYRLPNKGDQLDSTLVDIVSPEFCLTLLGPVLTVAFIGALIHVATKSCDAAKPPSFRKSDLRRLSSFPSHICFQTERKYVGQPGRILRASWGLFWVILSSAYSAYLVITFTIEPQELKIDSFEQLLETSDYSFGVDVIASSLFTLAQTSTTGTLNTLWKRLLIYNKTDPATFSSNRTAQLARMLQGNFVLICFHRVDDLPFYIKDIKDEDYSMVRAYQIGSSYNIGPDYISLPKNAFYKETLNKFLLGLEESGILLNLREEFQLEELLQVSTLTLKLDSENQVKLSRITLLLYVSLVGVLTATLCLCIEICYCKLLKCFRKF